MLAIASEPSSSGGTFVPVSGTRVGARRLRRWIAAVTILGIAAAVLTGWMGAARATAADRLDALSIQLDQRAGTTRAMSGRLAADVVAAKRVHAGSAGADPAARQILDDAIRLAEAIAGQRLTTQEPASVTQAEMLLEQADRMERALGLAATDLRTAVGDVRASRPGYRPVGTQPARYRVPGGDMVVVQP